MNLQKILEAIIQVLFLGFGDKIKGYRTVILNVGGIVAGAYEWFIGSGLLSFLCESFNVACNATDTAFFGVVVAVMSAIQMILRLITTGPVPAMVESKTASK